MTSHDPARTPWPASLDTKLQRALRPPALSTGFRDRLHAAIAADAADELESRRSQLVREFETQLETLEAGYVRLKWKTLGTLIGAAFMAGIALALALPWIREIGGASAEQWTVALAGVAFVAATAAAIWPRESPLP